MSRSFMCGGNVSPARFVKPDTSETGGVVLQCGAGERPIGISQPGTRNPPISGLDDGYAGIDNVNTIIVYTETDEAWLQSGGSFSFGALLKSDSSGRGVNAGSDADIYGAVALQSATAADQLVRVRVRIADRAS